VSAEAKCAQEISFSLRIVPTSRYRAPDHVRTQVSLKKLRPLRQHWFFLGDRHKPYPIDRTGPSVRSYKIMAIPSGVTPMSA
jgi:hypothetical protein